MNASTVLVLVERHKLEQDAATALQLALGHNVNRVLCHKSVPLFTSPVQIPGSDSNPVMNADDVNLVPI